MCVSGVFSLSHDFSVTSPPALWSHHAGKSIFNPLLFAVHSTLLRTLTLCPFLRQHRPALVLIMDDSGKFYGLPLRGEHYWANGVCAHNVAEGCHKKGTSRGWKHWSQRTNQGALMAVTAFLHSLTSQPTFPIYKNVSNDSAYFMELLWELNGTPKCSAHYWVSSRQVSGVMGYLFCHPLRCLTLQKTGSSE